MTSTPDSRGDAGLATAPHGTALPPIGRAALGCAVVVTLALSLRIAVDTARYLSFDPDFAFLVERPSLAGDRVWLACFYVHVAGGIVCLLTAPWLLWNGLAGGNAWLHRAVGRVHAVAALGWTGPTGLYLAPFAKGGLAGQIGFLALGIAFFASTLLGVLAIRRGDLRRHVAWMIRSYALILSAVTFRVLHLGLHGIGVEEHTSYVTCTWTSLAFAIGSGELMRWCFRPAATADRPIPGG